MAKRGNDQSTQQPNSQLRVLFVELNGANTTIEEALRTVERMRRPADVVRPLMKHITNTTGDADGQSARSESTLPDGEETSDSQLVETDAEANQTATTPSGRQKRGLGPKTDRNAGIAIVPDLNFVPSGKPALKAFFAEKAPTSDMDQVLVLSYYLQHKMDLSTFGPGHILSAFKHVERAVPADLRATIRNMKGKAWLNFLNIDNISVATEGNNRVEHVLPKAKNQTD